MLVHIFAVGVFCDADSECVCACVSVCYLSLTTAVLLLCTIPYIYMNMYKSILYNSIYIESVYYFNSIYFTYHIISNYISIVSSYRH